MAGWLTWPGPVQIVEYLETRVFNEGTYNALLQKMSRELAILGFVSFTATTLMQFVELGSMEVRPAPAERTRMEHGGAPIQELARLLTSGQACRSSPGAL